jgi:hypothetical protein
MFPSRFILYQMLAYVDMVELSHNDDAATANSFLPDEALPP